MARTPRATKAEREQVAAVLDGALQAMEGLPPPVLAKFLPALRSAQEELQRDLQAWLRRQDGKSEFTAQKMRNALAQCRKALEKAKATAPAMHAALVGKTRHVAGLSTEAVEKQLAAFGSAFEGSIAPVSIDVAAVLAEGQGALHRRYESSAKRYAGQIGEDLDRELAVGVAMNLNVDQLSARLLKRLPHVFKGQRYRAERVVRTELAHTYNAFHREGVREVARETGDPGYMLRWDSGLDFRSCPACRDLEGRTAPVEGGEFTARWKAKTTKGVRQMQLKAEHPPLHPHCRCVLVAWHEDWPEDEFGSGQREEGPQEEPARAASEAPLGPPPPVEETKEERRRRLKREASERFREKQRLKKQGGAPPPKPAPPPIIAQPKPEPAQPPPQQPPPGETKEERRKRLKREASERHRRKKLGLPPPPKPGPVQPPPPPKPEPIKFGQPEPPKPGMILGPPETPEERKKRLKKEAADRFREKKRREKLGLPPLEKGAKPEKDAKPAPPAKASAPAPSIPVDEPPRKKPAELSDAVDRAMDDITVASRSGVGKAGVKGMAADDQELFREGLRNLVDAHGYKDRRVGLNEHGQDVYKKRHQVNQLKPGCGANGMYSLNDAEMWYSDDVMRTINTTTAKREFYSRNDVENGLRVAVHEQLHAASPSTQYREGHVVLEEATTEIAARQVTRDIVNDLEKKGWKVQPAARAYVNDALDGKMGYRSYDNYISGVKQQLPGVLGDYKMPDARRMEVLAEASRTYRAHDDIPRHHGFMNDTLKPEHDPIAIFHRHLKAANEKTGGKNPSLSERYAGMLSASGDRDSARRWAISRLETHAKDEARRSKKQYTPIPSEAEVPKGGWASLSDEELADRLGLANLRTTLNTLK